MTGKKSLDTDILENVSGGKIIHVTARAQRLLDTKSFEQTNGSFHGHLAYFARDIAINL